MSNTATIKQVFGPKQGETASEHTVYKLEVDAYVKNGFTYVSADGSYYRLIRVGEIIYMPEAKRVFRKENPDNIEVTAKIVYENGKGEYADEDGKRPHDIGYIHNGTTYLYRYERLTAKSCVYSYARGVWYRCGFGEAGVKNNPTKDNTIPPTIKVLEPGTSTWVDGYLIFGKAYSQKGIRPQDGAIIDMRGHKVYNSDGTESADYVKYNKAKDIGEPYEMVQVIDADSVQEAFNNSPRGGDWDDHSGLQCVDLSRWFVDTYTTLSSTSGHGKDQAANTASVNNLPAPSSIPRAPAIFSTAADYTSFGASGGQFGHTGIVLSVDEVNQIATYIDTYNSLTGKTPNSRISTHPYPAPGVTFTYLGDYLKDE